MLKTSLRFTYLDAVLEKKRVIPFRPPLPLSCAYARLRTWWISGVYSNTSLRVNRGDHVAFPSQRSRFQAGMSAVSAARRRRTSSSTPRAAGRRRASAPAFFCGSTLRCALARLLCTWQPQTVKVGGFSKFLWSPPTSTRQHLRINLRISSKFRLFKLQRYRFFC